MTKLVGILNLTPDSFSDGGQHATLDAQLAALHRLMAEGADMVDVGAESTRPGAKPLSVDEEWGRLQPFIVAANPSGLSVPLSLDTYHPANARKALDAGFAAINDVSGFRYWGMVEAVRESHCKLVMMHSLTVPVQKDVVLPADIDVVEYLMDFARIQIENLAQQGINRSRIIFDPGIGFGKSAAQNREILARAAEFKSLGVPLYIGHSRKSFMGEGDRDAMTLEFSKQLIAVGVDYLRVHHVAAHRRLL